MLPPLAISMAISSWRCSPFDMAPAIVLGAIGEADDSERVRNFTVFVYARGFR